MALDTHTRPGRAERHARTAVAALFFTNGALLANLLPRLPEVKAGLGLGNVGYGIAVAAFPAGAMVAGLAAGVLIRRVGSSRVAVVGTVVTGLGILAAGVAPVAAWFVLAMFLAGACDALTDVGQNAHGLRVQRRYGRTIINSFHAVWSIGSVTGGGMAAAAIALGLPLGVHLSLSLALFAGVALGALRFCLPGPEEPHSAASGDATASGRFRPRMIAIIAALVLIAVAGAWVEDVGNSWAALYLGTSLDAPGAIAATGYIALVGAQFVGRLLGDRLVDRFGQRAVARAGGVITALGMGLALAWPTVPGTIAGLAAAGYGVATLIPAALQAADELPGLRHGTGLTVVSWLMRIGFLLSPLVVGMIADAAGLRAGLLVVPCAGLLVVLAAAVLPGRRSHVVVRGDQV